MDHPERQVDEAHLAMIRSQPCSVHGSRCLGTIDPHHLQKRKAGGSDYSCVPLCRELHVEIEATGTRAFEARYGVDLWLEAWRFTVWTLTGVRPHTKNRG